MRRQLLWLGAVLVLVGCEARIQHGLDERQANELLTVLTERGFGAKKVAEEGKKPSFAIEVDQDQATDAVRVLSELGLPRPRSEGFGEVFGKGSLVPTATEERALYLQALSGELGRTLEAVEGVTAARVHLVLPPPPRPGQPPGEAKASAFLRARPGAASRLASQREELRALLAGSVEGLRPEGVTLVVNEVATQVPSPEPAGPPVRRLRLLVALMGLFVTALSLALVYVTWQLRALRTRRGQAERAVPVLQAVPAGKAA